MQPSYTCQNCGSGLRYIPETNSWFCDNCRNYSNPQYYQQQNVKPYYQQPPQQSISYPSESNNNALLVVIVVSVVVVILLFSCFLIDFVMNPNVTNYDVTVIINNNYDDSTIYLYIDGEEKYSIYVNLGDIVTRVYTIPSGEHTFTVHYSVWDKTETTYIDSDTVVSFILP